MAPKKKGKPAPKAKDKQQPAARLSASPAASQKPRKKAPAKKSGRRVHGHLDGDLDVEICAKGLLQEVDHMAEEWEMVELLVDPNNLEYINLPSLPANWVESLKIATAAWCQ